MDTYAAAANIDYYSVEIHLSPHETVTLHIGWKNNAWRRRWTRRRAGLRDVLAAPAVWHRVQSGGAVCLLIE